MLIWSLDESDRWMKVTHCFMLTIFIDGIICGHLLLIMLFTYDFLPWFLIGCRLYSQRSITQFELLSIASITIWILFVPRPLGNNNMKHTAYIRLLISIFSRKQSTELLLKEPWCHLRMLGVDKKTTLELDYTGHILVEQKTI